MMTTNKSVLALLVLGIFLAHTSTDIRAQTLKPSISPKPPLRIISTLKDDKSSPFKNGETVISQVRYDGLDPDLKEYGEGELSQIYEGEFRRASADEHKGILDGEVFSSQRVEATLIFLKKWLTERGFLEATVVALGEKLPKNRMNLIFGVERGGPVLVSVIRFTGSRRVTNEELVDDFRKCVGDQPRGFDRRLYEYCANNNSRSLLHKHGFFKAKIRGVRSRIVRHGYEITIDVEEGIRYRWGAIKIRGNTVFSEKEILEMMGQTSGDVADTKELRDFLFNRLQLAYAEKGFIQYSAEYDPVFSDPAGEGLDSYIDMVLTLDEGRRYTFRKIAFTRVAESESQRLIDEFPLKEGDVFVRSKLKAGIEKINGGKRFHKIDSDRDVEIRTDEAVGTLDIVIALKKIDE